MDWSALFGPDLPVIESLVRGSVMYLGLFTILRLLRRPTGQLSVADILLITVLADASQNGMAGGHESVASGLLLVLTIVAWDQLIDWASFRSPRLARLLEGSPSPLIVDGRPVHAALERRRISLDELLSHLRQSGFERIDQVKRCCLEPDGSISVIGKPEAGGDRSP